MPVHLLRDVDVVAVSIVDKGANRKRIYLRKAEGEEEFTLPATHTILKDDGEWSAFYCVVAEPGATESPGVGSPGETLEDTWASADEIRRAAHRFMKNGALVNKMHEGLEPYGTVVENFVAQKDYEVGGEIIKEGSWVIGIEPSPEGRTLIDAGEFTGVSIQGTGIRELAKDAKGAEGPKAKTCPKCGGTVEAGKKTCQNCGHSFAVEKVSGRALPSLERAPGRKDNWVEAAGGLPDFIERIAKHLHYEKGMTISRAIATAVSRCKRWAAGLDGASPKTQAKAAAAIAEWNRKKARGNIKKEAVMADDNLSAWRKLGISLGLAKSDDELTDEEKNLLSDAEREEHGTVDAMSDERLAKIEENLEKSAKSTEALANRMADIAELLASQVKSKEEEQKVPTTEEVYHRLDEVAKSVTEGLESVRKDLDTLAKGDTSQETNDTTTVQKSSDPLAGLLLDA